MATSSNILRELAGYEEMLAQINREPLKRWLDRFKGESHGKVYLNETLGNLLEEYQGFAVDYFGFVKSKIIQNNQGLAKQKVRHYMYRVMENLQREWDLISRVCIQRENKLYRDKLTIAEQKAKDLYKRFKGYKVVLGEPGEVVVPVTYFGKLFSITRYLFTPYPILSIPVNAWGEPGLWDGGLAHELGHHLFWNSLGIEYETAVSNARARFRDTIEETLANRFPKPGEALKQFKEIWNNWSEELFADVVGTCLMGPDFAVGTIKILDERVQKKEDLLKDDRAHPIFLIRPLIAISVLQWVKDNHASHENVSLLQSKIGHLTEEWKSRINIVDSEEAHPIYKNIQINWFIDSVEPVIKSSLERKTWVDANQDPIELSRLFDFDKWLAQLKTVQPETAAGETALEGVQEAFEPQSEAFKRFHKIVNEKKARPEVFGDDVVVDEIDAVLNIELGERALLIGCYQVVEGWLGRRTYTYQGSCG